MQARFTVEKPQPSSNERGAALAPEIKSLEKGTVREAELPKARLLAPLGSGQLGTQSGSNVLSQYTNAAPAKGKEQVEFRPKATEEPRPAVTRESHASEVQGP